MTTDGVDGDPVDGTVEITGFVTYAGEGFALVRSAPERGDDASPTPASSRRYLRGGLPALYQEEDFTMRLVAALEGVLDPIVAVLDSLPAHFDPQLAPIDILDLAVAWLGLDHNEAQPTIHLRALVQRAGELGRLRGTRDGMALALELNFPELRLRIEDGGGVVWGTGDEPSDTGPPAFVVYCDSPISQDEAASVARVIESVKPAHVGYRLRVKGPRAESGGEARGQAGSP
jgi:phage tail-like protein